MDIRKAIKADGHKALRPLYNKIKPKFLAYMSRYTQDSNLRMDAFHEAMIAFYEYCLDDKYDPKKSSPKTLIFKMGSAYLFNRLKKEKRESANEVDHWQLEIEKRVTSQHLFSLSNREIGIRDAILKMGEKCRELLNLFFYLNYSIDAIRIQMKYKNENVVSSHKSRCIKQLKEILQEKV